MGQKYILKYRKVKLKQRSSTVLNANSYSSECKSAIVLNANILDMELHGAALEGGFSGWVGAG